MTIQSHLEHDPSASPDERDFVHRIEVGANEGTLWYTFPLMDILDTRFYMVPPTGFEPVPQA